MPVLAQTKKLLNEDESTRLLGIEACLPARVADDAGQKNRSLWYIYKRNKCEKERMRVCVILV